MLVLLLVLVIVFPPHGRQKGEDEHEQEHEHEHDRTQPGLDSLAAPDNNGDALAESDPCGEKEARK